MALRDYIPFVRKNTPVVEKKEAPQIYLQSASPYQRRKDDFKSYADEGYRQNAVVYRCVNEIANGAASIPIKVCQGDIELDSHPLISLLQYPNPLQSGVEYFQSLYSYLLLSGNSFAVKSMIGTQPRELHLLRPDRVEIKPSTTTIPKGYVYKLNGKEVNYYEADPLTGQSEMKHFKTWNPLDDYLGLSPLMAAAIDVDQHNMIAQHNISLLANGARPSGAIVFKPTDDSGMQTMLSDGQRKQISDDLRQRFTGTRNAGRPVLLEGDFDWKEMGMSPKDMDFMQNKNMAARDIALCFGVPSQLVGIPDAQTYANVQEARLALYEETIIPLAKRVENDLNEWLTPHYGEDIYIKYDMDLIPAMVERRRKIYENVTSAVREGIISRNEARERLGYEPITGGDDVYVAANLFPLGSPTVAEAEGDDAEEDGKNAYGYEEDYEEEITQEEILKKKIDLKPTEGMAEEAVKGLAWRAEFKRGGTSVGVARANQLKRRDNLSEDTVKRMFSFFSRHEVDKQAEGFKVGEKGYPSAGRIAWALWGGDAGFSWSRKKRNQINAENQKLIDLDEHVGVLEVKELRASTRKGLENKVKQHNEKYGDTKTKRVTLGMLEKVYNRGVGAYRTNPQSVRPSVSSPEQWAMARVNSFLKALSSGKFRGGKHDTDVFPKGHPLSSKGKDEKEQIRDDVFTTVAEAESRASEIGCVGYHSHDEEGRTIYMPCETHEEYTRRTGREVSGYGSINNYIHPKKPKKPKKKSNIENTLEEVNNYHKRLGL